MCPKMHGASGCDKRHPPQALPAGRELPSFFPSFLRSGCDSDVHQCNRAVSKTHPEAAEFHPEFSIRASRLPVSDVNNSLWRCFPGSRSSWKRRPFWMDSELVPDNKSV
mmetsp:Transcript_39911/g.78707  ORF Transcript_39911/g.78707 Transcript_39911/m.78707 type:complete len:109 (+) Transcript_39911:175-501(+)